MKNTAKKRAYLWLATILILPLATLLYFLKPTVYEAVLIVLAYPTIVYVALTLAKSFLQKSKAKLHAEVTTHKRLEKQRQINRSKGLTQFFIPYRAGEKEFTRSGRKHEIWALNRKIALQIYAKKIKPIEKTTDKTFFYINAETNNL